MSISEKVAYLKGLMEGMEINTEAGEGKLLALISDILGDMAAELAEVGSDLDDLSEGMDDLLDLVDLLDEDDDEEEPIFFDFTCPACGKTITVDEDVLELGAVQCPDCGEMMDLDLDLDEEDDED